MVASWWPCCCGGGGGGVVACDNCFGDEGPPSFQVTVSGFANNSCSTCSDFDGTYVCDFVSQVGVTCTWESDLLPGAGISCQPSQCRVTIAWNAFLSQWELRVTITSVIQGYQWISYYSTIPSCLTFSSEPIGDGTSAIGSQCVRPGYAYVTSL